jgi:hypothetical protein
VTYDAARMILPGDVIRYDADRVAEVTGPIHVFKRPRGQVVFVPVRGELVDHTRIDEVRRG